MIKKLKRLIKKLISYPDNSPSKHIFQELTYDDFILKPELLNDYLCNLYKPTYRLKFFSFRKFFKLPSTFEFYMRNLSSFFAEFSLDQDDIVIDVGGHHGIFTINMAALGARVHCFEPNPMSYTILNRNIESNSFKNKPIVHNCAVSSGNNERVLFDIGVRSTAGSLERLKDKSLISGKVIEVSTIDLNKYIQDISQEKIKILKMDCEGAEHEIFKNFDELTRIKFLIIEAHEIEDKGPRDIIKKLQNKGYIVKKVKANHGAVELYCKLIN